MKLHVGSIQRKGKNLYLVSKRGDKIKWIALKTSNLKVATIRARRLIPPDTDEQSWLRHLSRIGHEADGELQRRHVAATLTWRNLWGEFLSHTGDSFSAPSIDSYERWTQILVETAESLKLHSEDIMSREHLGKIGKKLLSKYISGPRMIVFYRRMWRCLGLNEELWSFTRTTTFGLQRKKEFYRRLTSQEIKSVHAYLQHADSALADMLLIGYSTSLRLSDVAELNTSEVRLERELLEIIPNKTRRSKPHPLRIPLTTQAMAIIRARVATANAQGYLFDETARHRPSRKISAAFRKCKICPQNGGRASFHSLRATFISLMDEAGVSPHITDAITGHAGGGMHARYTQPTLTALRMAMARAIPPI